MSIQQSQDSSFDAIVIGSGIGGLTVASLLAQLRRWRVLVLERHFKLGGFTHVFQRPGGFRWDVGLHYVGEMAPGRLPRALMDFVTQGRVQWRPMPSPMETFVFPGFTFAMPVGEPAFRRALIEAFPEERRSIERYLADVHRAARWFQRFVAAQSLSSPWDRLLRRVNALAEPLALATTRAYLDRHFRDPRLKAVLAAQWGDYGLPPGASPFGLHALIVAHYLDGGYYPVGGAGVIAEAVRPIVEENGGACLLNHTVTEVLVEDGRAIGVRALVQRGKTAATVEFHAPVVISDAGAYATYCRLLPETVSLPFRARFVTMIRQASSFVTLYLGLRENPSCLGFRGGNHWLLQDYDHDELFRRRNDVLEGRPASCYLSFPSLKDPSASRHTAEVIAPMDYDAVQAWAHMPWRRRGADYEALKERIAASLLDLVERHYPGFRNLVAYRELSTPLTIEAFTGHANGLPYGLPATPERFRQAWLRATTPVRGLYLTGSDVAAMGVVGAMLGGVVTAARLLGPFGFFRILRAVHECGSCPRGTGPARPGTRPSDPRPTGRPG